MTLPDIKKAMTRWFGKADAKKTRASLQELHTYAHRELGWNVLGKSIEGREWQASLDKRFAEAIQECDRWQGTPERKELVARAIDDIITVVKKLEQYELHQDDKVKGIVRSRSSVIHDKQQLERDQEAITGAANEERAHVARLYHLLFSVR